MHKDATHKVAATRDLQTTVDETVAFFKRTGEQAARKVTTDDAAELPRFAVGDVVRLKLGGPEMNITRPLNADGEVCAEWTEDDGHYHRKPFMPAELTLIRKANHRTPEEEEKVRAVSEAAVENINRHHRQMVRQID